MEIEALTLRQGKNSLEYYNNQANELLTKTIDAIKLSPNIEQSSAQSHMKLARDRILVCFINGLNPAAEQACRSMQPKTLSEAFNICNELRNAGKLKAMLGAGDRSEKKPQSHHNTRAQPSHYAQAQTQQNATNPFRAQSSNFQNQNIAGQKQNPTQRNSNPFVPKPHSVQVPMDVDPSIRLNRNNPSAYAGNRAQSSQSKMDTSTIQRIFQLLMNENQEEPEPGEIEAQQEEEITEESSDANETHEINFLV